MEENERRRVENEVNEENQRKSGCIEKRAEANTQVELNGKWISWHTLVALEVLGQGFKD